MLMSPTYILPMNHNDILLKFSKLSQQHFPSTQSYDFSLAKNLLSDFHVPISKNVIDQISNFIKTIYSVSRNDQYSQLISTKDAPHLDSIKNLSLNQQSVLMAYDFHIEDDAAQLIEVNTNASGYLISNLLSLVHQKDDFISDLKNSFESEFPLNHKKIQRIAILDENPKEQNMNLEFLMYNDLFKSWGYDSDIYDIHQLNLENGQLKNSQGQIIDFVYNRFCDFYLEEKRSQHLYKAYINQNTVFSPQPKEYLLLADKSRMISWSQKSWLEQMNLSLEQIDIISKTVTPISPISDFEEDELWKHRKKYFFKPSQSFGGKSVYRGKSISRKPFERLLTEKTLVQKYVPAPTHTIGDQDWKFEIRAYVYQDKIQQMVVRSYQGQVTNFRTLGGGFSLIDVQN